VSEMFCPFGLEPESIEKMGKKKEMLTAGKEKTSADSFCDGHHGGNRGAPGREKTRHGTAKTKEQQEFCAIELGI